MKKEDLNRRLFVFFSAIIILLVEVAIVAVMWLLFYNSEIRIEFWTKGHYFIMAIYTVMLLFFSLTYGGLRIGTLRISELLLAQTFTTLFANIGFYTLIVLLAYYFPTIIPLVFATLLQSVCIFLWILGATNLYRRLFPPIDILLIYDGGGADGFVEKVKTRRHQFKIVKKIQANSPLEEIYKEIDAHEAVMMWDIQATQRNTIFKYCYDRSVKIYVMPKISDIILNGSEAIHMFDTPLLLTKSSPLEFEQKVAKRVFDLLFALILFIITSPVMLITALSVKLYDGGSILYKQIRCTENGRKFQMYKFRSMIEAAEQDGVARLAAKNDDRITPIGKFIRKVRIDELPQLANVIKGDMSFIGPRPERPEIIEKYTKEMPEFSYRVKVKAGLSGYAQIYGKYNTLPYDKLKLDLYYIEHYSIWLDLKLMILTLKILLTLESTEGVADGSIIPETNTKDTLAKRVSDKE